MPPCRAPLLRLALAPLLLLAPPPRAPAAAGPSGAVPLVPPPASLTRGVGRMTLSARSRVVTRHKDLLPHARALAGELALLTGLRLSAAEADARAGDVAL